MDTHKTAAVRFQRCANNRRGHKSLGRRSSSVSDSIDVFEDRTGTTWCPAEFIQILQFLREMMYMSRSSFTSTSLKKQVVKIRKTKQNLILSRQIVSSYDLHAHKILVLQQHLFVASKSSAASQSKTIFFIHIHGLQKKMRRICMQLLVASWPVANKLEKHCPMPALTSSVDLFKDLWKLVRHRTMPGRILCGALAVAVLLGWFEFQTNCFLLFWCVETTAVPMPLCLIDPT